MFDKMKSLWEMQKQMQEIKRQLDNATFEVESPDRCVKITMNGSQEVQEIKLEGELSNDSQSVLAGKLKDTFNRAIKKSHDIAAQKMKGMAGLNLPGMM